MDHSARPLIGITPSLTTDTLQHGTFERYVLARTYTDAVRTAGGIPIILPPGEESVDALLNHIDGVLLSGGGDLNPLRYGDEATHSTTYGVDAERDGFELDLVRSARARDLPLLGICRGIQALNVAFGGTLIQDITDQLGSALNHRQQQAGYTRDDTSHDVQIEYGAHPLSDLIGNEPLAVNSFHHQAIRDVAPGLKVVARAPDELIEAVWSPEMRFCLAVQWHPEMLAAHPRHHAIFAGLVAASSRTRAILTT